MIEHKETWPKARDYTRLIDEGSKTQTFAKDFTSKEQPLCAAVPIMPNIPVAFDRGGGKESQRLLSRARASWWELCLHSCVAYDQKYLAVEKSPPRYTGAETHRPNARRLQKIPAQTKHERNQVHHPKNQNTLPQQPAFNRFCPRPKT